MCKKWLLNVCATLVDVLAEHCNSPMCVSIVNYHYCVLGISVINRNACSVPKLVKHLATLIQYSKIMIRGMHI